MSNTFPILLSFTGFVPFILRMVIGLYFIYFFGEKIIKNLHEKEDLVKKLRNKSFVILGFVVGVFITIGFYTQVASLVGIALVIFGLFKKTDNSPMFGEKVNHIFLIAIFISLFISGAGFIAFDLPF